MDRYFLPAPRRLTWPDGLSLAILFAPALALGVASLKIHSPLMFVGAIAEVLIAFLVIRSKEVWRPPASGLTIILYTMALGWLWLATGESSEPGLRVIR